MSFDSLAALKPYLSFFHPIIMWILLVVALYVMYLGVQAATGVQIVQKILSQMMTTGAV